MNKYESDRIYKVKQQIIKLKRKGIASGDEYKFHKEIMVLNKRQQDLYNHCFKAITRTVLHKKREFSITFPVEWRLDFCKKILNELCDELLYIARYTNAGNYGYKLVSDAIKTIERRS